MKVTLSEFGCVGMMVADDMMLDRYWYGPTGRISPEAPVSVVKVSAIKERSDDAANAAMNIAFLGANAHLIGLAGIDDAARALSKSLTDVNVKCNFIPVPTHSTITKLRVLPRNQQLIRLDFEEGFEGVDPQPLHERINQALSSIGALMLFNYARGALASVQQTIQLARKADVPVPTDPKDADFGRHRGATPLTPNLSEFEAVIDECKTGEEIVEHGMKLVTDHELSALLVTRFEQDVSLLQPDKTPLHMPTQAQRMYDVTNAGDTMIGVLATTLVADNSLEEARFLTNAAAGVVVGKLGTSMVSPVELESAVRGRADTGFGMITEEELRLAIAVARKRGEKVVMTNGIFDILCAGCVSYLADACKLGDRLIIAVNDGTSTKRLKGDSRPINPFEQRMIVLGALEAVDWVVSLEKDTPQCLIIGILPDLLVKGGDYKPEEIAGSKEVQTNGGEVLVLNFEDGYSTTNIIKEIQLNKKD